MVADPSRLRFYVDETSIGLGLALARARSDVAHVGHPLVPELTRGLLDPEWMPRVAARGLIVLGRDRHLRTCPGERELFGQHGLRVLRLGGRRDLSTWDALARLVRHWDQIEQLLHDRPEGLRGLRDSPDQADRAYGLDRLGVVGSGDRYPRLGGG